MRATENPITYVFAHPRAKRVLYALTKAEEPPAYNHLRTRLDIDVKSFHRITRRLAQFALIHLRAPPGARFKDDRIRLVVELAPHGREMVEVLRDLDDVVRRHHNALGAGTADPLLVPAD